jgi:hypothetical protein
VSQARFQKQQREKARRERAAAKWAKRLERSNTAVAAEATEPVREQTAVLADLAALHVRFDAGLVSFEDFETAKRQLTDQLDIS